MAWKVDGVMGFSQVSICVLLSGRGRGTNLQAILDACAAGIVLGRVDLVVATREDAPALLRAAAAGVPSAVISPKNIGELDYAEALQNCIQSANPDLICLAGYMRMLPAQLVKMYPHRILNVHPALLPLFGGAGMYGHHVYDAVMASGMKVTGCTVHFVDYDYDTGPIVVQHTMPILEDDTAESLAVRLLPIEHAAFVEAIGLYCADRLTVIGNRVRVK